MLLLYPIEIDQENLLSLLEMMALSISLLALRKLVELKIQT